MSYEGPERREPEGWHFDKRIPIATLVTMLTLAISGFVYITNIRKDVDVQSERINAINKTIDQQEAETNRKFEQILQSFRRMDDKLDRIIERTK
jgi:flagellar capping protein FliD